MTVSSGPVPTPFHQKAETSRHRKRRKWPQVLLALAFSEAIRVVKPSAYLHVWDEEPGARSWAGEVVHDVTGCDPNDAEYWVAVLLAMPWPMQAHFFSERAAAMRHAWHIVAHADSSQAPAFLHARSLYMSERSRIMRFVRRLDPPLDGGAHHE